MPDAAQSTISPALLADSPSFLGHLRDETVVKVSNKY